MERLLCLILVAAALIGCADNRSAYNEALHNYTMELDLLDKLEAEEEGYREKIDHVTNALPAAEAQKMRAEIEAELGPLKKEISKQVDHLQAAKAKLESLRPER